MVRKNSATSIIVDFTTISSGTNHLPHFSFFSTGQSPHLTKKIIPVE